MSLPINVFNRTHEFDSRYLTIGAANKTIADRFPGKVILHWFTGTRREVERAARLGLYFSVNPAMVTSQKGRELVDAMPRDRVLTESDGPFVKMGPQPADPTCAPIVLNYLARAWHVDVDDVARAVLANLERG